MPQVVLDIGGDLSHDDGSDVDRESFQPPRRISLGSRGSGGSASSTVSKGHIVGRRTIGSAMEADGVNATGGVHFELPVKLAWERGKHAQISWRVAMTDSGGDVDASPFAAKQETIAQVAAQEADTVNMFIDASALKDRAHKNVDQKEYDVSIFYKDKGLAQYLARHSWFINGTLIMITLNALWIGVDVEFNDEANLNDAEWYFKVGEYTFAVFFTFEWLVRFSAFRQKFDGLRDKWFCFDTFLVTLMVIETVLIPNVLPQKPSDAAGQEEDGGGQDLGQLSILRLLRLLRLTRMVRLMRSLPELMALLLGMSIAFRSVMSTLVLLVLFMYIFSIIIRSQLNYDVEDPDLKQFVDEDFGRLPYCMWTLLLKGAFLDSITSCANNLLQISWPLTCIFVIFVMLSSFMILNMLVGLMFSVVHAVSCAEKEKILVATVRDKLMMVLERLDEDGNGTISRTEFNQLLEIPEACEALEGLGVDVANLLSLSDHLFEADDSGLRAQLETIEKAKAGAEEARSRMPQAGLGQQLMGRVSTWVSKQPSVAERDTMTSTLSEKSTTSNSSDNDVVRHASSRRRRDSETSEPGFRMDSFCSGRESADLGTISHRQSNVEDEDVTLSFADFIETVIRLRSTNTPSNLDLVDLRRLFMSTHRSIDGRMSGVEQLNSRLSDQVEGFSEVIKRFSAKDWRRVAALAKQGTRQRGSVECNMPEGVT